MISFQKCSLTHFPLLFDIALRSYTEAYTYLWDDNGADYIKKTYSRSLWETELTKDKASYYLVFNDQEAVGYFKLKETALAPYLQKDCFEIDKLYFLQSFTGQGIGKSTINFITNLARSQHKHIIWLNVMLCSPANSFYQLNGFEKVQESYLDYSHMKEEFRTLITYIKKLGAGSWELGVLSP